MTTERTDELDECANCGHRREQHRHRCEKVISEFGSKECGCEYFESLDEWAERLAGDVTNPNALGGS